MDTNILAEIRAKNDTALSEIERLKADLADAQFELEGCRDIVTKLSAEICRLRERDDPCSNRVWWHL